MFNNSIKRRKGFTLSEMVITMAVLAIFFAVSIPFFTIQKKYAGNDKDAGTCIVTEGAADLDSSACAAVINKCKRNNMNACNSLLALVSNATYTEDALKVIDQTCTDGGEAACKILINRCIDDSDDCDAAGHEYDIHKYLDLDADDTSAGKTLMYNLLKDKLDLDISNISDSIITACSANPSGMGCTLLSHEVYDFNMEDEFDFTEEESETGTIFRNGTAYLINPSTPPESEWAKYYGKTDSTAHDIVLSTDGVYAYVCGEMNSGQIYVMKIKTFDGKVVWKKAYGSGAGNQGNALALANGYLYFAGVDATIAGGGGNDALVMKLNEDTGAVIWANQYGGAGDDGLNDIEVSGSTIYVAGWESSDAYGYGKDILIMKIDDDGADDTIGTTDDGTVTLKYQYGNSNSTGGNDEAKTLILNGSDIYVSGHTKVNSRKFSQFVMKLNTSLVVQWKHYWNRGDEPDQECGFAGYSMKVIGTNLYIASRDWGEVVITKMNTDGTNTGGYSHRYTISDSVGPYGMYITGQGANQYIYLCGYDGSVGHMDIFVIKMNESDSSEVWTRHFGNSSNQEGGGYANQILRSNIAYYNGYLYVVDTCFTSAHSSSYALVMKINETQTDNKSWVSANGNLGNTINADIINDTNDTNSVYWGRESGTGATVPRLGGTTIDEEAIRDAQWTLEGTTINTETLSSYASDISNWVMEATDITTGWTVGAISAFTGATCYYITTGSNSIPIVTNRILSATITQDPAANNATGSILYLVSFDGKNTWKKWTGSAWTTVSFASGASSGNTAAELEAGLEDQGQFPSGNSLDFAAWFTSGTGTPELDKIDIWYY